MQTLCRGREQREREQRWEWKASRRLTVPCLWTLHPTWQAQSCNPLPVAKAWGKHRAPTQNPQGQRGIQDLEVSAAANSGPCASATHGQKALMSKPQAELLLQLLALRDHIVQNVHLSLGQGTVGAAARGSFWQVTALRLMRWFEGRGNEGAEACKLWQELYEHALWHA